MASGHFRLSTHNFMVTALGLCVKWSLVRVVSIQDKPYTLISKSLCTKKVGLGGQSIVTLISNNYPFHRGFLTHNSNTYKWGGGESKKKERKKKALICFSRVA
jgi:hypothetical protein